MGIDAGGCLCITWQHRVPYLPSITSGGAATELRFVYYGPQAVAALQPPFWASAKAGARRKGRHHAKRCPRLFSSARCQLGQRTIKMTGGGCSTRGGADTLHTHPDGVALPSAAHQLACWDGAHRLRPARVPLDEPEAGGRRCCAGVRIQGFQKCDPLPVLGGCSHGVAFLKPSKR
jgi:hypothetical protein